MANVFAKELGIPLPKCCSLGSCCKGASPSTPYHQLLKRAAQGDDFARGFFSIMVPYQSHQEAEVVVPGIVERTRQAATKLEEFHSEEDVVFYHCQYQTADNKCGVWEDRPQFCRDYPDTPFVVMAPGCAFEAWGAACKEKYHAMKAEVAQLKALKEELAALKTQANPESAVMDSPPILPALGQPCNNSPTPPLRKGHPHARIDATASGSNNQNTETLSLVLSLTKLYVGSPLSTRYIP